MLSYSTAILITLLITMIKVNSYHLSITCQKTVVKKGVFSPQPEFRIIKSKTIKYMLYTVYINIIYNLVYCIYIHINITHNFVQYIY